jgi:2'-5' RNA ligase
MIRAFLALRPDDDVLKNLKGVQQELGQAGIDARWVSADAVHLTIQFLGDVREHELPEIERGLREAIATVKPFEVEFRGLGVFPNQKKPRAVWVGLHGDGIAGVADAVETVLSPLGFPPEEREMTPHITLGRLRSTRGTETLIRIIRSSTERSFGTSRLNAVTLYRSQLRPDGAVYTPVTTFPFSEEG